MISCKRASELISKQMDEKLSLQEEISLKVHLFICEFCEQFRNHIKVVRKALRSDDSSVRSAQSDSALPDEVKKKIKDNL